MCESIVRLMHYDPRWRQEFQQTRSSVLQSCMGWVSRVEHIGSTAISGLVARPIIDLLAGVDDQARSENGITKAADLLEGLNYRRAYAPTWCDDAVVLDKPRHGEPTHRVFLMPINSAAWQHAIGIRDILLSDRDFAIRFEEMKVARWRAGAGDPDRYERDKAVFFTHLIDQIDAG